MSDAETARSLSSSAVLLERDGRFYFFQPGLGVIASGDRISSAYARFSEAKRQYLEEFDRAGLAANSSGLATSSSGAQTLNGSVVSRPAFVQEMQLFATKTVIVLAIIGIAGAIAANAVGGMVGGITAALAKIEPISMVDVADKASVIVRDLRDLPADRRESLRQSIGVISRELQPFVDAWREPPPASPSNR